MHITFVPRIAAVLLAAGLLAGCSSTESTTTASTTSSSAQSESTSSTTSAPTASSSGAAAATKIDPNTASKEDLTTAFEAAGIGNAEKWADEVTEYGPYTAATIKDTLTKELGKYGIDGATLTSILNVLDPK